MEKINRYSKYLAVCLVGLSTLVTLSPSYGGKNKRVEENSQTQNNVDQKDKKRVKFTEGESSIGNREWTRGIYGFDYTPDFLESRYADAFVLDYSVEDHLKDEDLRDIKVRKDLMVLYLSENDITGEGLQYLQGLEELRVLDLQECGNFNEDSLKYVGNFKNLEELDLGAALQEGNGLRHLSGLTRLRVLRLHNCPKLGDAACQYLENFPRLSYLELSCTGITDVSMQHIAVLTNLEYLGLEGNDVTDKFLGAVKTFGNLKRIDLENTKVTEQGIEELKRYFRENYNRELVVYTEGFQLYSDIKN